MIVVLDSGPTGNLANPSGSQHAIDCQTWLIDLLSRRVVVCLPEIADYEIRRELLLENRVLSLRRLEDLGISVIFLTIDSAVMRRAAELWAQARKRGMPTADKAALDGDVIVAAQAQLLREATGDEVVVATDNVRHLAQFVDARRWQEIQP